MKPIKVKIQGDICYFCSYRDFARHLMLILHDSAKYASFDHRKNMLMDIMTLTGFPNKNKWIDKIKNEKNFLKAYWDVLLSLENLGTLPGFSVNAPIEKGYSNYNPEKVRITTNWVLLKKD